MTLTTFEVGLAVAGDVDGLTRALEEQRLSGRELAHELNDATGETLLHICFDTERRTDRSDVIRLLVHYGSDVNALNLGLTPLHLSTAWCDFPGETNVLIDFGARIDARDEIGWTPLHFAACNPHGSVALGRVLMRRGADLTLVDDDGFDAEYFANSAGNREFAQLFAAVKLAGSWRKYSNAHRIDLVILRTLCERGRARPPTSRREPVLARLFPAAPPIPKKAARLASRAPKRLLPNEIFRLILSFWRTDRDD